MIPLKYNTASQEVPLGQFLDSTDGDTEESGLTIANTDIKLWKSGATTLASKNSGGATYISNGVYYAVLDATDTNTYGPLIIYVHVSGALATKLECTVMESNAYDALYAASGTGQIESDLTYIHGTALTETAGQLASAFKKFFDVATPTGTVDSIPDAVAGAAGGIAIVGSEMVVPNTQKVDVETIKTQAVTAAAGVTINPSVGAATIQPTQTQLAAAFTEIKGATWAAGTDTLEHIRNKQTDIETDTAEIGAAGVGLTSVALADATSDTVMADAVWNALTASYGDTDTYGAHVESLSAGGDATEAKQDIIDTNLDALIVTVGVAGLGLSDVTLGDHTHGGPGSTLELSDYSDFTGVGSGLTALASGTAQSGTASTIVLAASAAFLDDELNGNVIGIHTGTGAGQSRVVLSNTNVDDTCNVSPNWATNPDATSQYEIVQGSTNTVAVGLTTQTANDNGADINTILVDTADMQPRVVAIEVDTDTTIPGLIATAQTDLDTITGTNGAVLADNAIAAGNYDEATAFPLTAVNGSTLTEAGGTGDQLTAINLPNQTMDIIGSITGNLSGSVGSVTNTVGSVTGAVGSVTGAVGSVTGNVGGLVVGTVAGKTPSEAGDLMGLSASAITSAKFDSATAYPVTDAMKDAGTAIAQGTVSWDNTNATTTIIYCDDITTAAADHWNGRIMIFTSGTLANQATDITDYALVAGEGEFTVTAVTSAPADNVTFIIV